MSKKESKIQNLQNTLKSLNKNKAELTKGGSSSSSSMHLSSKGDLDQDSDSTAHYHTL